MVEPPSAAKRRTKSSSWRATIGIQARGRLVEDDEPDGLIRDRERARDLDHLALRERQIADDVASRDPVTRKDGIKPADDQLARVAAPAQTAEVRVEDPGILGNRQVGTQ